MRRAGAVAALGATLLAGCVAQRAAVAPQPQLQCATAMVVGLQWLPAAAAVRYRVLRDGVLLGTASGGEFADTTVAGSRTYRYTVEALGNAALGNAALGTAAFGAHAAAPIPLSVTTAAPRVSGDAPYCASSRVRALHWDFAHALRAAPGSDLWPATWGRDGKAYLFFGDGGGFGGDDHRGRTSFGIAAIAGPPPLQDAPAYNVYGGFEGGYPSLISGKARSLLAIDEDFFALAGLYRRGDARALERQPIAGSPGHVELVFSKGNAHAWQSAAWTFCTSAEDGAFCPSGFVNFGPGGRGMGAYVYLYGASTTADRRLGDGAAHTYLARVRARRILTRTAYEYFAGTDARARPRWSADQAHMTAVFTDRNMPHVGCGGACGMAAPLEEAVYNAGLKRYIGMAQGEYLAQTAFYEAPTPWGPWRTLAYDNIDPADGSGGFAHLGIGAGSSLGVHAVNAWTSADGRTMWMTYSSDGVAPAGAEFPPPGTPLDALQLVRVELDVAD